MHTKPPRESEVMLYGIVTICVVFQYILIVWLAWNPEPIIVVVTPVDGFNMIVGDGVAEAKPRDITPSISIINIPKLSLLNIFYQLYMKTVLIYKLCGWLEIFI